MSWRLTKARHTPESENQTPEEGQWTSEIRRTEMVRMKRRIPIAIAGPAPGGHRRGGSEPLERPVCNKLRRGLQLDGTWMVTVTRINPQPASPGPSSR
jgi:hypothetical protein